LQHATSLFSVKNESVIFQFWHFYPISGILKKTELLKTLYCKGFYQLASILVIPIKPPKKLNYENKF